MSPPLPMVSPINNFVGRKAELRSLCQLLRNPDVRLLTLVGPGGVGKSRIALQAAHLLEADFEDGIGFTPLAHTTDPDRVMGEIAGSLGFSDTGDPDIAHRLGSWLRHRTMLLVVDNLEQVSDCSTNISILLKTCPHITILATSRVNLNVYGEHTFTLDPLHFTGPNIDQTGQDTDLPPALQLFIDRAESAATDFEATNDNLPVITRICQHLDGLPLAIELAATQVRTLSITDLERRLESDFSLLSSTSPDVPPRLRTMHNAIQWSYDLLSNSEQDLFRRLSVFANGFTLNAVAAVMDCDPDDVVPLKLVNALMSNSLLMRERHTHTGVRFSMLHVIREFALEQLTATFDEDDARAQHLAWMTTYAQRAAKEMVGHGQRTGLQGIDVERDNIEAALKYATKIGDRNSGLVIVSALWLYWNTRGMISEGLEWTSIFLDMDVETPEPLLAAGYFTQGILSSHAGDLKASRTAAQKSLTLSESVGEPLQLGLTYYLLGLNKNKSLEYSQAEGHFLTALRYLLDAGEVTAESAILNDLGRATYLQGDLDRAEQHYTRALKSARNHRMPRSISMSLHNLGMVAIDTGDKHTAAKYNLEALSINLEHGDEWHVLLPLIALVRIAAESENMPLAARLTGVAEALVNEPGVTLWDWTLPDDYAQTLATTRNILANEHFQAEIGAGRQLSLEDAISEAQVLLREDSDVELTELLTPRERDVLRLLLAGCTDREIGERLYISHRTAQTHLSSAYRKLGVHSRNDAIEWARQRGISFSDDS